MAKGSLEIAYVIAGPLLEHSADLVEPSSCTDIPIGMLYGYQHPIMVENHSIDVVNSIIEECSPQSLRLFFGPMSVPNFGPLNSPGQRCSLMRLPKKKQDMSWKLHVRPPKKASQNLINIT